MAPHDQPESFIPRIDRLQNPLHRRRRRVGARAFQREEGGGFPPGGEVTSGLTAADIEVARSKRGRWDWYIPRVLGSGSRRGEAGGKGSGDAAAGETDSARGRVLVWVAEREVVAGRGGRGTFCSIPIVYSPPDASVLSQQMGPATSDPATLPFSWLLVMI
jgi:hypothetical protein